ncbi:PEP-CTERM sorting domain-containing protein [Nitrogeniibacter aestuarii]|uniref:PEP-CTERM sorting domain-containing protein n=1 Tax=Nitrogeniibacter aestuarii TaxID=2815343 RepID=UPI001E45B6EC|nr:PEP-CTERM sorting domain-containing protein [Nitrogeniibacter aestuarii]
MQQQRLTRKLPLPSSLVLMTALFGAPALADNAPSEVAAIYTGTVSSDRGLGFIGEQMTVAFRYNASVAPREGILGHSFPHAITSMSVTLGSESWTWVGGPNEAYLSNDEIYRQSLGGAIDRVSFWASDFSGPELTTEPAQDLNVEVYFSDLSPAGMPDALQDDMHLPRSAFDPRSFDNSSMSFSFSTFTAESTTYYYIGAVDLRLVSAVPEPSDYAMWLTGIGLLGAFARRVNG